MEQYFELLTYVSIALFVYTLVAVPVAIGTNIKPPLVRFFCITGISAALLVAINSGIIYFWHHYYR